MLTTIRELHLQKAYQRFAASVEAINFRPADHRTVTLR